MPLPLEVVQQLLGVLDANGDGCIDYKEFVDVLARDTVAPAALGKRDMQSTEAMGVSAYAAMDEQLGHGHAKAAVGSINDK